MLIGAATTAPDYRLFVLDGSTPLKPGMIREPGFAGPGIAVEVWALPPVAFGQFAARIPAPLGLGKVQLSDGQALPGFLCEGHALRGATEITPLGGWRGYLDSLAPASG